MLRAPEFWTLTLTSRTMLVVDLLVVKETIAVREMIAGLDLAVEEAVQVLVLRPVATKEIVALI